MLPSPFVALVLVLGVYRLCRLVGWDDFPPVERARAWLTGESLSRGPYVDGNHYVYRRPLLHAFLTCAFCFGFWLGCLVYVGWLFVPTAVVYALAPFALNGAVGLLTMRLDR